jgi:hypothetical protein
MPWRRPRLTGLQVDAGVRHELRSGLAERQIGCAWSVELMVKSPTPTGLGPIKAQQ